MQIAISLMGGLGLFLYGMNLMADGLQKSAGEKLKRIVGLLTSNVLMGGSSWSFSYSNYTK